MCIRDSLMEELTQALDAIEADESVRAIVLTGGEKVFAAGADIKGMKDYSYMDAYKGNFITRKMCIRDIRSLDRRCREWPRNRWRRSSAHRSRGSCGLPGRRGRY